MPGFSDTSYVSTDMCTEERVRLCILDEQPGRMRGQEHDRNAREGGSWPLACCNSASTLWPAWPCPSWFLCFFNFLTVLLVTGPGPLIPTSDPHLLETSGDQACWCEGPPATMLLAEPMGIWLQ